MNTNPAWRAPAWRSLVWAGVVASVLAWTWSWFVNQGVQVFMVFVALAAVALAYRATSGMRLAIAGLMVAGFLMFLASLYLMFFVLMPGAGTTAFDILTASVFPLISSAVLLLGAAAGYRHYRVSTTPTTSDATAS